MVAHLLRLKLRLVGNSLRRSPGAVVGLALGILYAGGLLVIALAGLFILRLAGDLELSRQVSVLGGAALVVGWSSIPVLLYGTDPTLDPGRLAVYPLPPRALAVGLALAGVIGVPGLATLLLMVGVVVLWSGSVVGLLAGLVTAVCGLATCILLSRVLTTAAASLLQSRRGRDSATMIGLVGLLLLAPALNASVSSNASDEQLQRLTEVVGWTPPGWTWAAAADLAEGRWAPGLVRTALALGLLWVLFAVWTAQTRRAVVNPRGIGIGGSSGASAGAGLLGRLPGTPMGAVAARSLTAWRRDPRLGFPAFITSVIPASLLGPGLAGADLALLAMPVLSAYLLGFGQHNDVGHDSTPFWLHVTSGISGRDDRLGRLVPPALLACVLIPGWTLLGAALADRWDLVPVQLGVSIALLLSGFGVSSLASALRPYAVPGPGDSPFATPPGSAGVALLVQFVCGTVTAVPCIPTLVLAVLAYQGHDGAGAATLVTGVVTGLVVLVVGLRMGASRFDRRSAELMQHLVSTR